MKDRSRKINNMFQHLTLHFNTNRSSWENINYLSPTVNSFLEQSAQHNALLVQSHALNTKFAYIRDEEREVFNLRITHLAGTLQNLSVDLNNPDLNKAVSISKRALWSNHLSVSFKMAENIMQVAQLHEDELQANPTTKLIFDQAKTAYQSFTTRIWLPGLRRNERTLCLQNIKNLEKSTLELLRKQLDFRIMVTQNGSPDFFEAYNIIRKMPISKSYRKKVENTQTETMETGANPSVALVETPVVELVETPTAENNNPNEYAIAV